MEHIEAGFFTTIGVILVPIALFIAVFSLTVSIGAIIATYKAITGKEV